MGGPETPTQPTLNPEQVRLQQQAQADRITSIQDRVSDETRDLLIRFGRRKLFAGAGNLGGGIGGGLPKFGEAL